MLRLGVGWANLHLLALDQIDGRVEDHLIAVADAVAHLDLFSQITYDRYFPQVNDAVFDHGDLRSISVENDRVGRHHEARGLARNVQLDGAVDSRRQCPDRIGYVDFREQRSRTGLQRISDTRHRSRESTTRDFGHLYDRVHPRRQSEGLILRDKDLSTDHVALHDGEHEGAADRVGLHERTDVYIALGDHAIKRRHDTLIGLLLGEDLDLRPLRRRIGFRHTD